MDILGPDSSNESILAVLDAFVLQEEAALLEGKKGQKRSIRLILMSSILPYLEIVCSRTRALHSVHRQIVHKRSVRLIHGAFSRSVINASSRHAETLAAKKARETQEAVRKALEEDERRSYE